MTSPTVLRDDREAEGVVLLRLHRPEALNALNLEMRHALVEALEAIEADSRFRATVITGDLRAFAAGADVALLADAGPADIHALGLARLWARIAGHRKPLVAAVNGHAVGAGFELALLCDAVFAGPGTRFALPEVKLGIMPGAGGTQRLVRLVGKHRAMGLLWTGDAVDAQTAHGWGIVTGLADSDEAVLPQALAFAAKVAQMPALAVEMIKSAVLEGADLPLDAALLIEQRSMQLLFDTAEQKARMAAFLARRKG